MHLAINASTCDKLKANIGGNGMKRIIGLGMALIFAGCGGTAATGVQKAAAPVAEGWFSPDKTSQQLAQDLDQCKMKCLTA
jgi:hypothetical protein